jgi:FixJ family two-component response regulator
MIFQDFMMTIRRKTIAIIDKDAGTRIAMMKLLSAFGFAAETYESATAYLDTIASSDASCLVVDVQLGDISGVELARQLAADGVHHPIIFTATDNDLVREQAEKVGAAACLTKPFPGQLLIEAIIKAWG